MSNILINKLFDFLINKLFVALFKIPWVKERWANQYHAMTFDNIPWTPLKKPLSQCKIALLTTGGVHLKTDDPFNMQDPHGDHSYRSIPAAVSQEELMITHDYYDHTDADQDINLVLPLGILRKCQQQGLVGPSVEVFYSFMGHIEAPHLQTLIEQTAPEVARLLKQQGVDIAMLVPA